MIWHGLGVSLGRAMTVVLCLELAGVCIWAITARRFGLLQIWFVAVFTIDRFGHSSAGTCYAACYTTVKLKLTSSHTFSDSEIAFEGRPMVQMTVIITSITSIFAKLGEAASRPWSAREGKAR